MTRGRAERVADVRRLLTAAGVVYADRARLSPDIVRATGLSPEGVELGFASWERDAPSQDLEALVAAAGDARHVHVVLSANVFVAPLRALAIGRAAADAVTVRPSPRDPVLARALVEAAADPAVVLVEDRDIARSTADEIHVYGRTEAVEAVRARAAPGAKVRGHASGMGVAWITAAADLDETAERLCRDVVAFDQRGCLSPRVALVEGGEDRAVWFARALADGLTRWANPVPRGRLHDDEVAEATRWRETMAFAGRVYEGNENVVASTSGPRLAVPPSGRHVLVVAAPTRADAAARLGSLGHVVVTVGSDDPRTVASLAPPHARVSLLGRMQLPPLDGPVDRRG
ncbi:MAG TPA: acyl-CoA reductase [Polyangiaceae bacterium]|jgi:hypothetical protein